MESGDTFVYHSNKVIDSLKELDIQGKYYLYCFNLVENTYGKFVRLQIKQENKSGDSRTNCGILIHDELLDNVLNNLDRIKKSHLDNDHSNDHQNQD